MNRSDRTEAVKSLHVRDLEIADAVVADLPGTLEGLKRVKRCK
jgi:hypothetical protein